MDVTAIIDDFDTRHGPQGSLSLIFVGEGVLLK